MVPAILGTIGSTIGSAIGKIGGKIGEFASSDLGNGLISFGLDQLASGINSKRALRNAKRLMASQDNLNRKFTHDSYGIMRSGLEEAGYNPLLALGSSANSALYSSGQAISDSDQGNTAVNSALASRLQNKEIEKLDAEIDKIRSEKKDIDNKPRNILVNELKDVLETGKSQLFDKSKVRLKNLIKNIPNKINNYKNSINSAISNNHKVYQLHAIYNDDRQPFYYRPDLDSKGNLPPELSRYHHKKK